MELTKCVQLVHWLSGYIVKKWKFLFKYLDPFRWLSEDLENCVWQWLYPLRWYLCTCFQINFCIFPDCLENPKTNENIDESVPTIETTSHNGIYVKIFSYFYWSDLLQLQLCKEQLKRNDNSTIFFVYFKCQAGFSYYFCF